VEPLPAAAVNQDELDPAESPESPSASPDDPEIRPPASEAVMSGPAQAVALQETAVDSPGDETADEPAEADASVAVDTADAPDPAAERDEPAELKLVPAQDGDEAVDEPDASGDGEPEFIDPTAPEITTQQVIEAILFAADTPLTLPKIVSLL